MKNKDIEKRLCMEIKSETPDVSDYVLSKCNDKNEKEFKNKKKAMGSRLTITAPFMILLFIVCAAIIALNSFDGVNKVATIVELDVNPSIELKLNSDKHILEVNPLNNDGKKILGDMDLKGSSLNIGMNAIVGAMYKNGYLDELKNSVLVSIKNNDNEERKRLEEELTNEMNSILSTYSVTPSVLTQEYSDKNVEVAKENGISKGKADFIDKILQAKLKSKNGELYTFDNLADLNINELNAILNSKKVVVEEVTTTGTPSTKKYIGYDKAKETVLKDANVAENTIYDYEIEMDYEYGLMIYDISFDSNGKEYEYELDAITGKILQKEIETDDDSKTSNATATQNNSTGASSKSEAGSTSSNTSTSKNNNSTKSNSSTTVESSKTISRTEAKNVAFRDAGVNERVVRNLDIELDKENGKDIYEVSFEANGKEYDYDIDVLSGKILKREVEIDD